MLQLRSINGFYKPHDLRDAYIKMIAQTKTYDLNERDYKTILFEATKTALKITIGGGIFNNRLY